jgi:diketogulonate reductase-like aldo/keto reductase
LLSQTDVIPVVNQIEAHPYLQQPELRAFCDRHKILVEAYSPLGNNQTGEPRTVDDAKVQEIAQRLGKDGGQLLVSWGIQKGHVVLPKSVTESRIRSNFEAFDIPQQEFEELNALERHKRFNFPAHWGFDIFDEAGETKVREAALQWAEKNKI